MQIRPLTKQDYDHVVRVIDEWWGGPSTALAHPIFFYELGRMARVVESEGQLVGFLLGFISPDTGDGYVHLVGIHPDFRRRGVGRLLYTSFEEDCASEGVKLLKAISPQGNEGSLRFHQAQGWQMENVGDYAGRSRARVVYTRKIAP